MPPRRSTLSGLKSKNVVIAWLSVVVWMIVIFAASTDLGSGEHTSRFLIPILKWLRPDILPETIELFHSLIRKAAHLIAYAVLGTLVWRAVGSGYAEWHASLRTGISFLVSGGYAVTDEFHQSYVGTRTASPRDVLVDCSGALIAVVICWRLRRIRARAH